MTPRVDRQGCKEVLVVWEGDGGADPPSPIPIGEQSCYLQTLGSVHPPTEGQ